MYMMILMFVDRIIRLYVIVMTVFQAGVVLGAHTLWRILRSNSSLDSWTPL